MRMLETKRGKTRVLAVRWTGALALVFGLMALAVQPAAAQECVTPASPNADATLCEDATSTAQKAIGGEFELGDVFAAIGSGQVAWFEPDGTLVSTLNTGLGGFTTGMAFDENGKLYVTNFSANAVSVFDTDGTLQGTFGTGYTGGTESILFNQVGEVYVGAADGDRDIRKFDATGTPLAQYNVATESRGSDWIDLDEDQCTMYYTSEGQDVLAYDVCTDTQLSNFVTGVLNGGAAYALRQLPDGGFLVADTQNIKRLDAAGNVIQTYDVSGVTNWFALNLDPDGTSFWSGSFTTNDFYRFDVATGALLAGPIASGGSLFGLAVFGEITEATCDVPTLTNAEDIKDSAARTLTNTVLDTDGVAQLEFTSLNNVTVASVTSPEGPFTSSDGKIWTAPVSPGPLQATYTLQATADNGSYFVVATDNCPTPKVVDFDPPFDLGASQTLPFTLDGSYPNPTRGASTVRFALDKMAPVQLSVYDVMGRKVATLVDGPVAAGEHEVRWDGHSSGGHAVASGVYLLRLEAGDQVATRRLTVVK